MLIDIFFFFSLLYSSFFPYFRLLERSIKVRAKVSRLLSIRCKAAPSSSIRDDDNNDDLARLFNCNYFILYKFDCSHNLFVNSIRFIKSFFNLSRYLRYIFRLIFFSNLLENRESLNGGKNRYVFRKKTRFIIGESTFPRSLLRLHSH